jgi:hypothetical protein
MKLISTEVTNYAIPGTVSEIMVLIVRKEKSSNMFQMYWINKEKMKLTSNDLEISRLPSLNVDAKT